MYTQKYTYIYIHTTIPYIHIKIFIHCKHIFKHIDIYILYTYIYAINICIYIYCIYIYLYVNKLYTVYIYVRTVNAKNIQIIHILYDVPVGAARVFGVQMWLGETHRPSI